MGGSSRPSIPSPSRRASAASPDDKFWECTRVCFCHACTQQGHAAITCSVLYLVQSELGLGRAGRCIGVRQRPWPPAHKWALVFRWRCSRRLVDIRPPRRTDMQSEAEVKAHIAMKAAEGRRVPGAARRRPPRDLGGRDRPAVPGRLPPARARGVGHRRAHGATAEAGSEPGATGPYRWRISRLDMALELISGCRPRCTGVRVAGRVPGRVPAGSRNTRHQVRLTCSQKRK